MVKSYTFIEASLSEDKMVQEIYEASIKFIRPHWKLENIKSKVFSGGLTNKLVRLFLDGQFDENAVIVRLYGKNTERFIDRQAEIDVIKLLHKKNFGFELYAVFGNGFCYDFIHGSTLTMETCRSTSVYPIVAAEMAKMHSNIPIHKNKEVSESYNSISKMWDKFETFNELVEEILQTNADLAKRLSEFGVCSGFGTIAINEIKEILETQKMGVTLCHNDLLLGNIIYNEKTSKVSFIDFEFAMPNYPAFDVANHFNEFAGIDNPDFSKCPDRKFKSKWIAEYLKTFKVDKVELNQETFEKWVELCIPASHLFWALQAIVKVQISSIDFDYARYFELRFGEYKKSLMEVRASM